MLGTSSTDVTADSLAGSGSELILANDDGTLKRATGIEANAGSLTVANDATIGGTLTATGATNLQSSLDVQGATTLNGATTISGGASVSNGLTVTGDTPQTT